MNGRDARSSGSYIYAFLIITKGNRAALVKPHPPKCVQNIYCSVTTELRPRLVTTLVGHREVRVRSPRTYDRPHEVIDAASIPDFRTQVGGERSPLYSNSKIENGNILIVPRRFVKKKNAIAYVKINIFLDFLFFFLIYTVKNI